MSGSALPVLTGNSIGTSFTYYGWEPNIQYFWHVQAIDLAGNTGDWSETGTFIIALTKSLLIQ